MSAHLTENDRVQIANIENRATVRSIIAEVSQASGISRRDIKGPARFAHIVRARHAVCYIAHRAGVSYSQIARELGRDHTTISHAVDSERRRRGEMSA